MSGIINQVGARSGIISGGSSASAGTVTLSGITGLDYEEGTWTPTWATAGGSPSTLTGIRTHYTKIGRKVFCSCTFYNNTGVVTAGLVGGLPFTSSSLANDEVGICKTTMDDDHWVTVISQSVATVSMFAGWGFKALNNVEWLHLSFQYNVD